MTKKFAFALLIGVAGFTTNQTGFAGTLEQVQERQLLRCGISTGLPGFAWETEGKWHGFDVDMCRAVAAATLGDANKVEYHSQTAQERVPNLAAGKVDLLAQNTTWTLQRDMDQGISFAAVNFYDGQGLMVRADREVISALELDKAKVCVTEGTTSDNNIAAYFALNQMGMSKIPTATPEEGVKRLLAGDCDALTSDHSQLHALRSIAPDPRSLRILPEIISKEPLALAVREGDDRWRKIVQWTLWIMINAEYLGIQHDNVERIRDQATRQEVQKLLGIKDNFGSGLGLKPDWAYAVIRQVGNYGEVFERNLGQQSALRMKRGLNAQWNDGGLLYAPPIR